MNGYNDPEHLGWVGRLNAEATARRHDGTSYNLGVRRDTSADIGLRWHAEVMARLPAGVEPRLVFSFGVNDTTLEAGQPRVASAETLANTRAILGTAAAFAPTLFVGPPPIEDQAQNLRTAELSSRLADICGELRVPYLDTFTPLSASEIWMREVGMYDGAHPGAAGYEALSRVVSGWSGWQRWWD